MSHLQNLLAALDERTIAERVWRIHDEARVAYPLRSNTVRNWQEFEDVGGDYTQFHYTRCVARGGSLPRYEAVSRFKEIIENDYRRRGLDLNAAANDAMEGTNNGVRGQLDLIANWFKEEGTRRYIRHVFDQFVTPNSWSEKVQIMTELLSHLGAYLSSSIDVNDPARYAANYHDLIEALREALGRVGRDFRRF